MGSILLPLKMAARAEQESSVPNLKPSAKSFYHLFDACKRSRTGLPALAV